MTGRAGVDQLAQQFRLLADSIADSKDTRAATQRLTTLAARTIDGCDWAGLTRHTRRQGIPTTAVSSPTTLQVDQLQYELHEGPCVDAVTTNGLFHAPDLRADTRWPRFSSRTVADTPVRSVVSVTLSPAPPRTALNLYAHRADAFGPNDIELTAAFAVHAAVALGYIQAIDKTVNLEHALTTSRLIGTAMGILMYKHRITADEAFDRLTGISQRHNRKLVVVADHVTRTGELPSW